MYFTYIHIYVYEYEYEIHWIWLCGQYYIYIHIVYIYIYILYIYIYIVYIYISYVYIYYIFSIYIYIENTTWLPPLFVLKGHFPLSSRHWPLKSGSMDLVRRRPKIPRISWKTTGKWWFNHRKMVIYGDFPMILSGFHGKLEENAGKPIGKGWFNHI